MSDLRTAAQQALEALEFANVNHWWGSLTIEKAITALRAALAQQAESPCACWPGRMCSRQAQCAATVRAQQAEPVEPVEPVAYIHRQGNYWDTSERHLTDDEKARGWTEEPLYTAPPQRKPLTEEEIDALPWNGSPRQFARAVERKVRGEEK